MVYRHQFVIMATTTQTAQEQLGNTKCDICDTYKDVIWRCLNCLETLCNQCKTYHMRSKATRNHTITEQANTTEENPGTSIFCHIHEDEAFQMYCTTCNTLVCNECIIGTHNQHKYKQMGDIIKQNRAQLEETFDQIKTRKIPELEQNILSITQMQENYSQEIVELSKAITTKGEELKEVIDSLINILKQEVIQEATKDEKCLKETKEQIDQKLTALKTQLSKQEERVKRFGNFDIIVKTDDIKNSLSKITENSPDIPSVQPPRFQTGQNKEEELKKMIGGLALEMKQCLQVGKETTNQSTEKCRYMYMANWDMGQIPNRDMAQPIRHKTNRDTEHITNWKYGTKSELAYGTGHKLGYGTKNVLEYGGGTSWNVAPETELGYGKKKKRDKQKKKNGNFW